MKCFLHQLVGVAPGDALELVARVAAAVDLDAALGAAERHVDDGALVGHQRGERHHLVLVDVGAVADAALGRQLVLAVLGAPGVDDLDRAVVAPHREAEAVDAVAGLDLVEQHRLVLGERGRPVEVVVDLLEEAWHTASW